MNNQLFFSHKSDSWSTPGDLYDDLNNEFNFDFDPCPLDDNLNGLITPWRGNIFINPPYSNIAAFLNKGMVEIQSGNAKKLVYLLPVRTDTKWFHKYIYNKAEIRFIKGRLKFGDSKNSAPFPSMIVIFKGEMKK